MAEPKRYTASESARLAVLLARGATAIACGKSTADVDRAIDRLQAEACARELAERRAEEKEKERRLREKAEAKAKRRAESIWW